MSKIEQLHEQAMDLAEEAFIAKRNENTESAKELFLSALDFELQAASAFPADQESEPTRSILYRSAAALAYHAKEYELAEQLVAKGLSGYPPDEIKAELRALLEDISFHYHMFLEGTEIADNEMQMILWGEGTGFGIISVDLFLARIEQIKKIYYRTVERLIKVPYRTAGGPSKDVAGKYNLYLNGMIAGSFGVSFSIGEPAKQLPFSGEVGELVSKQVEPQEIIEEVISCFELLEEGDMEQLEQRFEDDDYFQNFVGSARQLAPDGNTIKSVSITSKRFGEDRGVQLTRKKKDLPNLSELVRQAAPTDKSEKDQIQITGRLKQADSIKITNKFASIKIVKQDGNQSTVYVPVSLMQDVVQPFYENYVTVTGNKVGNRVYFVDIDEAESPKDGSQSKPQQRPLI
ncbi:MAG: hypothetical protein KDC83_15325 [Flavobacteriales bacterium]|nr:hypothetical protein [Flavobacteriales bacterium]